MGMIEFTAIGMFTVEAGRRAFGEFAGVGVLHQAAREAETIDQIARATDRRIGQMPMFTGRVIGHDFPGFSKLR